MRLDETHFEVFWPKLIDHPDWKIRRLHAVGREDGTIGYLSPDGKWGVARIGLTFWRVYNQETGEIHPNSGFSSVHDAIQFLEGAK